MKNLPWPPKSLEHIEDSEVQISGVQRMANVVKYFKNPEQKLPPIFHVAGTNGKGSVTAFLKYIIETQGYLAHRLTSPHLVEYNERIEVAGKKISDSYLQELLNKCEKVALEHSLHMSYLTVTTIVAFLAFSRNKADATILEVGLGGELDFTNIIEKPEVSIITSISKDHLESLGNTIEKIAQAKAGIIKPGCPVVIGKQEFSEALKVLEEEAKKVGAKTYVFGKDWTIKKSQKESKSEFTFKGFGKEIKLPKLHLQGEFQYINAGTAIAALLAQNKLQISDEAIIKGAQNAKWPARMQDLSGERKIKELFKHHKGKLEVFLDGGHNEDGAKQIAKFVKGRNKADLRKNVIVCGMLGRKDAQSTIMKLRGAFDFVVAIGMEDEDAKPPEELSKFFDLAQIPNEPAKSFIQGLQLIAQKYQNEDLRIMIAGSLHLAGEVLEFIGK